MKCFHQEVEVIKAFREEADETWKKTEEKKNQKRGNRREEESEETEVGGNGGVKESAPLPFILKICDCSKNRFPRGLIPNPVVSNNNKREGERTERDKKGSLWLRDKIRRARETWLVWYANQRLRAHFVTDSITGWTKRIREPSTKYQPSTKVPTKNGHKDSPNVNRVHRSLPRTQIRIPVESRRGAAVGEEWLEITCLVSREYKEREVWGVVETDRAFPSPWLHEQAESLCPFL